MDAEPANLPHSSGFRAREGEVRELVRGVLQGPLEDRRRARADVWREQRRGRPSGPRYRGGASPERARRLVPSRGNESASYFPAIDNRSISNRNVEFAGIGPLAWFPYARDGGMVRRRFPPIRIPATP